MASEKTISPNGINRLCNVKPFVTTSQMHHTNSFFVFLLLEAGWFGIDYYQTTFLSIVSIFAALITGTHSHFRCIPIWMLQFHVIHKCIRLDQKLGTFLSMLWCLLLLSLYRIYNKHQFFKHTKQLPPTKHLP